MGRRVGVLRACRGRLGSGQGARGRNVPEVWTGPVHRRDCTAACGDSTLTSFLPCPFVLITAHEGHHRRSPARHCPWTEAPGTAVPVSEGSLRVQRSRGRFLNTRGLGPRSWRCSQGQGSPARPESVTHPMHLTAGRSLRLLSPLPRRPGWHGPGRRAGCGRIHRATLAVPPV